MTEENPNYIIVTKDGKFAVLNIETQEIAQNLNRRLCEWTIDAIIRQVMKWDMFTRDPMDETWTPIE